MDYNILTDSLSRLDVGHLRLNKVPREDLRHGPSLDRPKVQRLREEREVEGHPGGEADEEQGVPVCQLHGREDLDRAAEEGQQRSDGGVVAPGEKRRGVTRRRFGKSECRE